MSRRLRTAWLDAVIGWNQGAEERHRALADRARQRHQRAQVAWLHLNPHPWNRCRCPECHPRAEEAP